MPKFIKILCRLVSVLIAIHSIDTIAYVPPSNQLLKNWTKNRSNYKSLHTKSVISVASQPSSDTKAIWQQKFLSRCEFSFSRSIVDCTIDEIEGEKKSYRFEKKWTGLTGSIGTVLLFENRSEVIYEILKKAGVVILSERELLALKDEEARFHAEASSLGRILDKSGNYKVCWKLGNDLNRSQLWLSRDEFTPARWLEPEKKIDLRFEGNLNVSGRIFSKSITLFQEDKPVVLEEFSTIVLEGNPVQTTKNQETSNILSDELKLFKTYFR